MKDFDYELIDNVRPLSDFVLEVTFDDGCVGVVDFKRFRNIYIPFPEQFGTNADHLWDEQKFAKVENEGEAVTFNDSTTYSLEFIKEHFEPAFQRTAMAKIVTITALISVSILENDTMHTFSA